MEDFKVFFGFGFVFLSPFPNVSACISLTSWVKKWGWRFHRRSIRSPTGTTYLAYFSKNLGNAMLEKITRISLASQETGTSGHSGPVLIWGKSCSAHMPHKWADLCSRDGGRRGTQSWFSPKQS